MVILLGVYNLKKMTKQNKKQGQGMTAEDLLAIQPLPCIYCSSIHLKILGVIEAEGSLVVLCEECNKIFILFSKDGRRIELIKSGNKKVSYTE